MLYPVKGGENQESAKKLFIAVFKLKENKDLLSIIFLLKTVQKPLKAIITLYSFKSK